MFRGRTEQTLQPPAQISSLAYVRFRLRIVPAKQKDSRRSRNRSKYLGIADRNKF
jgi:hypothetical protein